jgi:hypothetical protein
LLLKEIGDVRQAVAFVEEHQAVNSNLSRDLIDYSVKHPEFLSDLLNYVGISSLNPKDVVINVSVYTHCFVGCCRALMFVLDVWLICPTPMFFFDDNAVCANNIAMAPKLSK